MTKNATLYRPRACLAAIQYTIGGGPVLGIFKR